jgi:hypothetical protein
LDSRGSRKRDDEVKDVDQVHVTRGVVMWKGKRESQRTRRGRTIGVTKNIKHIS